MSNELRVVRLTGWRTGFQTIDLTMLVKSSTNLGLAKAKALVELVLDGIEIGIPFETEEAARSFWIAAEKTGVLGQIESQTEPTHREPAT